MMTTCEGAGSSSSASFEWLRGTIPGLDRAGATVPEPSHRAN
jgi:hypothetical protein